MSIDTTMFPVRTLGPQYLGDTGLRMGKTIESLPIPLHETLTGKEIWSESTVLFWQETSVLERGMDPITYNSNDFTPTKYKFHLWLYSRNYFEFPFTPQLLGVELCNFVFYSNMLTDQQRRDHFACLIFDELGFDEDYYKIAMGSYLFASAKIWMKVKENDAQERFKKVAADWTGDVESIEAMYEAPGPCDQGISFSLSETFVLSEEVLNNLLSGLISRKQLVDLINLFKEKEALGSPIDASQYGKVVADYCYGIGREIRTRVEVLLLGLPLLVSQKLFFETLLCQYFEKKARNTAYFESIQENQVSGAIGEEELFAGVQRNTTPLPGVVPEEGSFDRIQVNTTPAPGAVPEEAITE